MMDNNRCCGDCEKCAGEHGQHMIEMECCAQHKMSKEHLKMKKEMLEKKLKMVKIELGEK